MYAAQFVGVVARERLQLQSEYCPACGRSRRRQNEPEHDAAAWTDWTLLSETTAADPARDLRRGHSIVRMANEIRTTLLSAAYGRPGSGSVRP